MALYQGVELGFAVHGVDRASQISSCLQCESECVCGRACVCVTERCGGLGGRLPKCPLVCYGGPARLAFWLLSAAYDSARCAALGLATGLV